MGRRNIRVRPERREQIDIRRLAMAMVALAAHVQRQELASDAPQLEEADAPPEQEQHEVSS